MGYQAIGCWQWKLLVNGEDCHIADDVPLAAVLHVPDYFDNGDVAMHYHISYVEGICLNEIPVGPVNVTLYSTNCVEYGIAEEGQGCAGLASSPTTVLIEEVAVDEISSDQEIPCSDKTMFNKVMNHIELEHNETSGLLAR